ncbi:hypothetical protein D779_3100 [Imhoffiella purpurea]|uniref:Uncharacterized protein n=1 Tax=Imhoffiella purpurea TaxID=1249627 RepID=W9VUJ1_9GAMM|nr:hypothetical protein D779_3100 [Imhoffiella purpurea]
METQNMGPMSANDPVASIEEAIRFYADAQPSQLYRGGA